MKRRHFACSSFTLLVFEYRLRINRNRLIVFQITDKQRNLLHFSRFKERRVEIRHFFKRLFYVFVAVGVCACQNLKKQTI